MGFTLLPFQLVLHQTLGRFRPRSPMGSVYKFYPWEILTVWIWLGCTFSRWWGHHYQGSSMDPSLWLRVTSMRKFPCRKMNDMIYDRRQVLPEKFSFDLWSGLQNVYQLGFITDIHLGYTLLKFLSLSTMIHVIIEQTIIIEENCVRGLVYRLRLYFLYIIAFTPIMVCSAWVTRTTLWSEDGRCIIHACPKHFNYILLAICKANRTLEERFLCRGFRFLYVLPSRDSLYR